MVDWPHVYIEEIPRLPYRVMCRAHRSAKKEFKRRPGWRFIEVRIVVPRGYADGYLVYEKRDGVVVLIGCK